MEAKDLSKNINTIIINDVEFMLSIDKMDHVECISIKLIEAKPNKKIYFLYEASYNKIIKDIKHLHIYENLDDIINTLKDMVETGKIYVEEKEKKIF